LFEFNYLEITTVLDWHIVAFITAVAVFV